MGARGALRIEAVGKRFGERWAVRDIDLAVEAGEFTALLGGSGCGKTTLLRMVAGLVEPDAGTIGIDGQPMTGLPPHRRPVNMMFQSYALFPHMSAADNVAFGLRREHLPEREVRARTGEALAMVRMAEHAARRPDRLSGGQRQRVALARALAKRPRVLLLDEPLSALDRRLREDTALELARLQRTLGTTFVMVTHDQNEALSVADRIAVMGDGRIRQFGTPADIYERPADRFVAGFVGSINLFEGTLGPAGAGRVRLDCPGARATLDAPTACPLPAAGPGAIGVRPERIVLSADRPLPATVEAVSYGGAGSLATMRLAGGLVVRAVLPAGATVEPGQAVRIGWPDEAALVFPGAPTPDPAAGG